MASSTTHGGQESTLLALYKHRHHIGGLVVSRYTDPSKLVGTATRWKNRQRKRQGEKPVDDIARTAARVRPSGGSRWRGRCAMAWTGLTRRPGEYTRPVNTERARPARRRESPATQLPKGGDDRIRNRPAASAGSVGHDVEYRPRPRPSFARSHRGSPRPHSRLPERLVRYRPGAALGWRWRLSSSAHTRCRRDGPDLVGSTTAAGRRAAKQPTRRAVPPEATVIN